MDQRPGGGPLPVDLATDKPLGSVGLVAVDHLNQAAEIGIFIGDKDHWGQGYGREALALLIDYGFQTLNLHNIRLRVYADNPRAIACYTSLGFKRVGKFRQALLRHRKRVDVVLFDLLPNDFLRRKLP